MEKLNNVINENTNKTNDILKKLNNIYGVENYKDKIKRYAEYLKLKKENLIKIGNANVLIKIEKDTDEMDKLIELIYKLLKINNIISGKYKRLTSLEVRDNKVMEKITEQMLIVDTNSLSNSTKDDLYNYIMDKKDKVFILIEKVSNERWYSFDEQKKVSKELVTWQIEITEPTIEEKKRYIRNVLRKNNIKVEKQVKFVEILSKKSISKIKEELVEIIIDGKVNNNLITVENFKKMNKEECLKVENKLEAIKELNNLIGLEELKNQIKQIVNYIKVNKSRGRMPSLHMIFEGNPGTGKTEVSRIIGKIFAEEKILSDKNVFIEAQRADLIGEYVGHTAVKTKSVIEKAKGGVLFIDEAYSLNPYGSDRDYGKECIATLIKGMEDNRENLCVILAGYTKDMEELMEVNSGFESRIQFKLKFPDYTAEELYEIFKKIVKEQKYKLSHNVKISLMQYFEKERQKENFSNGRCVRNLFEKIKFEQAERVILEENANKDLIKKCDVDLVMQKLSGNQNKENKIRIGFAS